MDHRPCGATIGITMITSSSQDPEDNNWDWEGTEEAAAELIEQDKTVPLFFPTTVVSKNPLEALQYTATNTGFDFTKYCVENKLDAYQRLRAVNFIRASLGKSHKDILAELDSVLNKDEYLQPFNNEDPMLNYVMTLPGCVDDGAWSDEEEEEEEAYGKTAPPPPEALGKETVGEAPGNVNDLSAREIQLTERLKRATELLKAYGLQDVLEDEDDPDNDTYYFDSYSHWGIHQEMLADRVRTEAYQHAIEKNRSYFEGKSVLDIGCGTGILSMFAARAGAKLVVGIDMSTMAFQAMKNVKENGLEDIVTIVHGKVEDLGDRGDKVNGSEGEQKSSGGGSSSSSSSSNDNKLKLLKPGSFDVILSEWMGYALVFECMLETVLKARDIWLKPNGLVLPNVAEVYVQGMGNIADWEKTIGYWRDVYGFKMNAMTKLVLPEAHVFVVKKEHVSGERYLLHTYDICKVKPEDLDIIEAKFSLKMKKDEKVLTGLCISFDCDFAKKNILEHSVKLPTGPECPATHWKQTVLYLPEPMAIETDVDHSIDGTLTIARNSQNPRHLDFEMTINGNKYEYKMG